MFKTVSIGKLVAAFGVKGELILKHGLGKKSDLKGASAIFIEEKSGSRLPYFLLQAKAKSSEETILELEGINTREAAQALVMKQVWLKEEDFQRLASNSSPISLMGYLVIEDGTLIGEIAEVIEQPHQVLCVVMIGEKEAYIPLHEESLKRIDRQKKQVHVQLPEGLLDIYLR